MTDEEYTALRKVADERGETVEALVHEALAERWQTPPAATQQLSNQALFEHLYRKGIIGNIPTGKPDTPEQKAELERLAKSVKPGKMVSDMVIDDRGPR